MTRKGNLDRPQEPSARLNPPFRADHVGSLLRPKELRSAYRDYDNGRLSAASFRKVQDNCIREVIALQESIGLQVVTDGEFRRASYWAHFVDAVEGFTVKPALYAFRDEHDQKATFLAPHVSGKLRRSRSVSGDEFDFLRSLASVTPKITLPSPTTMHFWRGRAGLDRGAYRDREAYFEDLAAVYRAEVADLAARGARYLQLDEVPLAMLCDPQVRESVADGGDDPQRLIDSYVDLINAALASRPREVTVAMHLCRGNFKGRWLSQGGYEYIAERLFNDVHVDAYLLEFDTPRAGSFAPLSAVPLHKTVVLGLVSTKTAALEPIADVRRRIDEASQFVPLERLALSPQCGFASTVAGNPLTLSDEVGKLKRVVEVARLVWN